MNQPYAGIFLKKSDEDDSEVVDKLSDLYETGTFAQIQEMQDLGDKLRLVVIAHRRIKITNQLYEDLTETEKKKGKQLQITICSLHNRSSSLSEMTIKFPMLNTQINVSTNEDETDADKRRRKHQRHKKDKHRNNSPAATGDNKILSDADAKRRPLADGEQQSVLMVEVENIAREQFKQTEEVKALTQEVIKTIRDIITMNPLYRESLQQMLHQNQRVVDNPVYLCDLGASLSAADPPELQAILEEADVSGILVYSYSYHKQKKHCIFRYQNVYCSHCHC